MKKIFNFTKKEKEESLFFVAQLVSYFIILFVFPWTCTLFYKKEHIGNQILESENSIQFSTYILESV